MLGYLDPERLAGGELEAPGGARARGHRAPRRHAARILGRGGRARDPRRRQRQHGARAIRSVTIERGRDPRDFTLVAFGGAGPPTRATWRRLSTSAACSCPSLPASSPPWACSRATSTHHFVRAARRRARGHRRPSAVPDGPRRALRGSAGDAGRRRLPRLSAWRSRSRRRPRATRARPPSWWSRSPAAAFDGERASATSGMPSTASTAATYGYASDEPLELVNVRVVATGRREHRLDFRARGSSAARTPSRSAGPCTRARSAPPGRHAGGRAPPSRAEPHAGTADRRGTTTHRWSSRRARPCPAMPRAT